MSASEPEMRNALAEYDRVTGWIAEEYTRVERNTASAKLRQAALYQYILTQTFPAEPEEGTTTFNIPKFGKISCVQKISRTVDEPVLSTISADLRKRGVPLDLLIRRTPELALKEYRKLSGPNLKHFDRCLIIKPAKPVMTITPYAP